MAVQSKPEGYHTVTPYLVVPGAADLIEFMKQAFGAHEKERHGLRRTARSCTPKSASATRSSCSAMPPRNSSRRAPRSTSTSTTSTRLTGAPSMLVGHPYASPQDQFYGDRSAGIQDRFGNQWWLATHVEDVSPEEMQKRQAAMAQA